MPTTQARARDPWPVAGGPWIILCRPAPLLATGLLLCNDHVLKGAHVLPGALTGKLSDLAGLFLAPILGTACVRALLPDRAGRHRLLPALVALATALSFSLLKLWPGYNRALAEVWGGNVMDPSDLLALPMVGLAWMWQRRADACAVSAGAPGRAVQVVVAGVAAFACMATSAPRYPRNYPMWLVDSTPHTFGCAQLAAQVSKSGKTGVGLTIEVRARVSGPCPVRISHALLRLTPSSQTQAAGALVVTSLPGEYTAESASMRPAYIYLPFAFDNNDMWNRQIRRGEFELELTVGGRAHSSWRIPAEHRLDGFHRGDPSTGDPPAPSYMAE